MYKRIKAFKSARKFLMIIFPTKIKTLNKAITIYFHKSYIYIFTY